MSEDIKTINETLIQLRLEVKGLDVKMDALKDLSTKVEGVNDIAKEALQKANQATDSIKWVWRTVGAALIVGVIGAVIKFGM